MRERQPRIRPREGGVELQRGLETVARLQVVVAVEAVHVPQAAVMCLPRVERAGRLQDRAVALGEFDLAGDRRDDAVADLVEHGKRVVVPRADGVGPDDARAARLAQLHADGGAARAALQRAAGHVVDVERAARLLGADVPLVEREHRALRDHEHAAQLGQPRDHVVRQRVAQAAAHAGPARRVGERHHRERRAARRGLGAHRGWRGR